MKYFERSKIGRIIYYIGRIFLVIGTMVPTGITDLTFYEACVVITKAMQCGWRYLVQFVWRMYDVYGALWRWCPCMKFDVFQCKQVMYEDVKSILKCSTRLDRSPVWWSRPRLMNLLQPAGVVCGEVKIFLELVTRCIFSIRFKHCT